MINVLFLFEFFISAVFLGVILKTEFFLLVKSFDCFSTVIQEFVCLFGAKIFFILKNLNFEKPPEKTHTHIF